MNIAQAAADSIIRGDRARCATQGGQRFPRVTSVVVDARDDAPSLQLHAGIHVREATMLPHLVNRPGTERRIRPGDVHDAVHAAMVAAYGELPAVDDVPPTPRNV